LPRELKLLLLCPSDGKKFLWVTAISLILNVLLNILCIRVGRVWWGDGGAAAGSSLATLVSEVFVLLSIRRIFPQGLEKGRLFGLMIVAMIPCILLAANFQLLLSWGRWWRLALILTAPVYLGVTGMVRREDLIYLRNLRKKLS
jgi:peptidoglycan biosynthesis protein MviN/MurJ (putative lipid II flippase)